MDESTKRLAYGVPAHTQLLDEVVLRRDACPNRPLTIGDGCTESISGLFRKRSGSWEPAE